MLGWFAAVWCRAKPCRVSEADVYRVLWGV
jgi:hypothetical protein